MLRTSRRDTYGIIIGVWAMVALYAVLHDQYLVRIAPEHFTEYHDPLYGIENPYLLAAVWGFLASFSPGLLLGIACLFASRAGKLPPFPKKAIFKGVLVVIALTEIFSASLGYYVHQSGEMVYPAEWYPDQSLPMLVTQTIQVSCYLGSAFFSMLFVVSIRFRRRRLGS